MPLSRLAISVIPIALTLTSCQADEQKTRFVSACEQNFDGDVPDDLCGCIYKGLDGEFTDAQLIRVADLFSTTISEGEDMLRASGTPDDLAILERNRDIEVVTETCFKNTR